MISFPSCSDLHSPNRLEDVRADEPKSFCFSFLFEHSTPIIGNMFISVKPLYENSFIADEKIAMREKLQEHLSASSQVPEFYQGLCSRINVFVLSILTTV